MIPTTREIFFEFIGFKNRVFFFVLYGMREIKFSLEILIHGVGAAAGQKRSQQEYDEFTRIDKHTALGHKGGSPHGRNEEHDLRLCKFD